MGVIVDVKWDAAGMKALDRTLGTFQGAQLVKTIDKAMGKEMKTFVAPLKAAEQSSGIHNRTGEHLKKIRARKNRKRAGEAAAWTVGPSDRKKSLLVRGHRIVTHSGRYTGKRSRAFPYPDPVFEAYSDVVVAEIESDVWAESFRR